jgi:hypothetical protein
MKIIDIHIKIQLNIFYNYYYIILCCIYSVRFEHLMVATILLDVTSGLVSCYHISEGR